MFVRLRVFPSYSEHPTVVFIGATRHVTNTMRGLASSSTRSRVMAFSGRRLDAYLIRRTCTLKAATCHYVWDGREREWPFRLPRLLVGGERERERERDTIFIVDVHNSNISHWLL